MADAPLEPNLPARELRRNLIAVGLGWLIPGLGHVFQGRVQRGLLFALLVWGSFGMGLAHEGRLALRDDRQPLLSSLQIVANLGVGPADILARRAVYGEAAYSMRSGAGPIVSQRRSTIFRERARSALSIYGTAYLWTAGLMNLLLLFDVWDIGRERES